MRRAVGVAVRHAALSRPVAVAVAAAVPACGAPTRAQRRGYRYNDEGFDDQLGDVMGPQQSEEVIPPHILQYECLVVRVGNGLGCVFKADRPNRSVGIKIGDILVATASSNIFKHKQGLKGLMRCRETGAELGVRAVFSQRRASFHDVRMTGREVNDHGMSLLVPDAATVRKFKGYGFPTVGTPARRGQAMYVVCQGDDGRAIFNQGYIEGLLPQLFMSDFGPAEWQDSFAGGPCFRTNSLGQADQLRRARFEDAHRATLVHFAGIVVSHDHSRPYDPHTYIACINAALMAPLAVSTFDGEVWRSRFTGA